jgi:tRNA-binding EMAP/Myf-like protein
MGLISWEDFDKVEMHVGKVERVDDFSEARNPSYLLTIDFGESTRGSQPRWFDAIAATGRGG